MKKRGFADTLTALPLMLLCLALCGPTAWGRGGDDEDEETLPFGAAVVIIELTDNDIELQVFVDGGGGWKTLEIYDPKGKRIYELETRRRLGRQGMSELFFASNPTPFPEDENGEIDPMGALEAIESFLRRFPAGEYEFSAELPDGELEGEGVLTHVLPALPIWSASTPATGTGRRCWAGRPLSRPATESQRRLAWRWCGSRRPPRRARTRTSISAESAWRICESSGWRTCRASRAAGWCRPSGPPSSWTTLSWS